MLRLIFVIILIFSSIFTRTEAAKKGLSLKQKQIRHYIRMAWICQRSTRISIPNGINLMRFRMVPNDKNVFTDFNICMFKNLGLFDENGQAPCNLDKVKTLIPEDYQYKVLDWIQLCIDEEPGEDIRKRAFKIYSCIYERRQVTGGLNVCNTQRECEAIE